jgi:hypothetical protein
MKLGEGIESLFREKQAAQSKLRSAIQHYQNVLEEADDAMLVARARFGLARAYESLGQLREAREVYEQIVGSAGTNAYISVAKERLKDLDRSATKDFYAWFGKQEPVAAPPASSLLPGTPGERLPFDPGSLGSPGGVNPSGSNFLDLPPLDKGTTGPLLPPRDKADENEGKDAADSTSKDEKKDAGNDAAAEKDKDGGAKEDAAKDEAVKGEAKEGTKEAAKEESTKDEKDAAGSENSTEKSTSKADDGNAEK